MALNKILNGKSVRVSAEEEAAIRAEWNANAAKPKKAKKAKPDTLVRRLGLRLGLTRQELDDLIDEPENG